MRGESSLFQRLLQFVVLGLLGYFVLFASARAQPGPDGGERFLAALEDGDRATLVRLMDLNVRTTAVQAAGRRRTLVGRASALGYLDGWRAGAARSFSSLTAKRERAGARVILIVAPTLRLNAPSPPSARLRIEMEDGRVTMITGGAASPAPDHAGVDGADEQRLRTDRAASPPTSASSNTSR